MSVSHLKVAPHSIEAEQAVLGCILGNPDLLHLADVSKEDFYRADHRRLFEEIQKVDKSGRVPDSIVVCESLDLTGELENVGGAGYVMSLPSMSGASSNLNSYAAVVRERAMLRGGIAIGHQIAEAGFSGDATGMQSIMADSLNRISGDTKDFWNPKESVVSVLERIEDIRNGAQIGLPFGVGSLDSRYRSGMKAGQLIVIGARPAMGKTAVALNIALKQKCPVGFISLEMPHDELTQRCLAIKSQVAFEKIDHGKMTQPEWDRFSQASAEYSENGLHVFDLGGSTIGQVTQAAMKMKHQHNAGLIVIDYVQLVNGEKKQNRNDEIGEITRQLKSLAKRLRIPIILLAQLNRELERRENKRPIMSDLRESGQIEQDADMIIFLYRDAIYNEVEDNSIEFLVEKCRNGPVSFCKSGWEPELMMLRDSYR